MKKKNSAKILIVIFIILVIISVVFLKQIILKIIANNTMTSEVNNVDNAVNLESDKDYSDTINETKEQFISEGKIVPDNYNFLTRIYEGDVYDIYLYEQIYKLVYEIIPQTNKELYGKTDSQIEQYFYENETQIQADIGIDTATDYIKFVNEVSKASGKTYQNSEFDIESYTESNYDEKEYYVKVILNITFSGDTQISVQVNIIDLLTEVTATMNDVKFLVE